MTINSILLFPKQLVTSSICPGLVEELVGVCYEIKRLDDTGGVSKSNRGGGWQSESIDSGTRTFQTLFRALSHPINECLTHGMGVRPDKRMRIANFWVNISGSGAYVGTHVHTRMTFSGVVYLRVPRDSGSIIFEESQYRHHEIESRRPDRTAETKQYHTFKWNPSPGDLILFPSVLPHSVEQNKSGEDRVTIAFNVDVR